MSELVTQDDFREIVFFWVFSVRVFVVFLCWVRVRVSVRDCVREYVRIRTRIRGSKTG